MMAAAGTAAEVAAAAATENAVAEDQHAADAAVAPGAADLSRHEVPAIAFFHGGRDPLGRTHDDMMAYSFERLEQCHDFVQWLWPLHEESRFASVFPVLIPQHVEILRASPEARRRALRALALFRAFYGLPALATAPAGGAGAASGSSATSAADSSAVGAAEGAPPAVTGGAAEVAVAADGSQQGAGALPEPAAASGEAAAPAAASDGPAGEEGNDADSKGEEGEDEGGGAPGGAGARFAGYDLSRVALWCSNWDHNLLRITRIIRSLRLAFGLEEEARRFHEDVAAVGRARGLSPQTLTFWRRALEEDVWDSLQGPPRGGAGDGAGKSKRARR